MSAFVVTDETIHDVVSAWMIFHPTDTDMMSRTQLGRKFLKMNIDAVNDRYPHREEARRKQQNSRIESYVYSSEPVSFGQLLKSCECLHYQCSEGEIISTDLYSELEELIGRFDNPAGYDGAVWDR